MNCEETSVLLHALIDGELDAGHAREVEAHIAACPDCAARYREFQEFRGVIAPEDLRHTAPGSLRSRIEGKLPLPQTVAASRRSIIKGFAFGAGASASASAIAASGLLVMVMRGDDQRRLLGEVVSAHLRSMQAQHLTDVVSTDQHTVKPWFNGHLDTAPPVKDFAAEGFPLIGGRLDYIDHRPVAAMVYRHGLHPINLFVWADPAKTAGQPSVTERQGYNIRHWVEGDLTYWLISDVEADQLAALEALLRKGE